MRVSSFSALALLAVAVLLLPTAAQKPSTPPTVSLPKGADLEAVVTALGSAAPGVVAADVSAVPRALREPLENAPLDQALARISQDFDRFVIRRGRTLVLQGRYSHPDEDPGPELEELRAMAVDMHRLIQPFTPRLKEGRMSIEAQEAFVASITREQEKRMLDGGLPFTDLSPAQRAAWLDINLDQIYNDDVRQMRRAMRCFTEWERTNLLASSFQGQSHWWVRFPDPEGLEGRESLNLFSPGRKEWLRPRPAQAEGVELPPDSSKPPAALRPAWRVPPQKLELDALPSLLREAGGPKVETPPYAGTRAFWLSSNGGTRAEALSSLALLWGWEVAPVQGGFRLGRPRLTFARDATDLHHKLRRAFPPALRHIIVARSRDNANDRLSRQSALTLQAAERAGGPGWKQLRVTQLDSLAQQRLANLLAVEATHLWYSGTGNRERPKLWVAHPEIGVFTLTGPLGPGRHPTLFFMVKDEKGKETGWGWAVGTAETLP